MAPAAMRILPWLAMACSAGCLLTGCHKDREHFVTNVGDGIATPTMATRDVRTLISDSGYTKYMISTPLWAMHEDAPDPFWRFPDGLDLEQYDREMRVTSTMRCDSAHYLSQKKLWRLDGNVVMVNSAHDSFLTQQVYWDQNSRQVYSDSFIHIVRSDRIIEGYGFTSDEQITAYTVNKPTGIFPVERRQPSQADTTATTEPTNRRRQPQSGADTLIMLSIP